MKNGTEECPEREGLPHEFQGEIIWEDGQQIRLRCLWCGRKEQGSPDPL